MGFILEIFVLNMGISLIIAFLLVRFIPLDITKRKGAFTFFLMGIGSFIPFLGNLVAFLFVILLKKYTVDFKPIEINFYPPIQYLRKNAVKTIAHGRGWADIRLHSSHYSQEERQRALRSVHRGLPRDTNLIYNTLISDDFEELRVCAFSLLETQQDFLQTKINLLLKKYEEFSEPLKKASLAKQISLLYWELVYRNLSHQEFRQLLLERSTFFANIALEVLINDATLLILLSKISIEHGNLELGLDYLIKAKECQAPSSKTLPYLAELAYKNKNYKAVKQYLSSDPSLHYLFKINKIVDFWCKNGKNNLGTVS